MVNQFFRPATVFECILDSAQCIKLKAILKEIISETTDSLRFYYLGEHHKTKVEQIGNSSALR